MSTTKKTLNIVLPYCGEATGIDHMNWLEEVAKHTPTQNLSRLVVIYATTCDMERYRAFTQRAKEIFDEFVEVAKYKASPNNLEEAHQFASYCFMTSWPHFDKLGAGVYIDPCWNPKEDYWADNFLAEMRVNQSHAIALAVKFEDKPSMISGCLGYSSDFFILFHNYARYNLGSLLFDRIAWEFKKFGHHASSENYPFTKVVSDIQVKEDVFSTPQPEDESQPDKEANSMAPIFGTTSEEDLRSSLITTAEPEISLPDPESLSSSKKSVKKPTKKATKKKRARRRTKAEMQASK